MAPIGIIAGTVFLKEKGVFSHGEERFMTTPYGLADVFTFPGAASSAPTTFF